MAKINESSVPFRIHPSTYTLLQTLEKEHGLESVGRVIMTFVEKAFTGENADYPEDAINPMEKLIIQVQTCEYEREVKAYRERCEKNKHAANARWGREEPEEDADPPAPSVRSSAPTATEEIDNECRSLLKDAREENFKITKDMRNGIKHYLTVMQPVVIQSAIAESANNGNPTWSYLNGILSRYEKTGIRTMADVNRDRDSHRSGNKSTGTMDADGVSMFVDPMVHVD